MAIDLCKNISGCRPYAAAMLPAGKSDNPRLSTWEARARGRKWRAVSSGLLAGAVAGFRIFGI